MTIKAFLFIALFATFSLADTIKVALASNVSYTIEDLKKEFNRLYPDIKVQVILGSTGKLTAQIRNKAPYDILMGANMIYPEALYKEGFAVTRPLIYAKGSLALVSSKKHDLSKGIKIVTNESIKRIAIANPKTAPYGKATIEALNNAKLYDKINKKLIYGESISQTLTYAIRGADLGFIAKSSLYSPQMKHLKKDKQWIEVDPKLYTPIDQGVVILKHGEGNCEVAAFYSFIFSQKAKSIFEKFGYIVP